MRQPVWQVRLTFRTPMTQNEQDSPQEGLRIAFDRVQVEIKNWLKLPEGWVIDEDIVLAAEDDAEHDEA